MRYRRIELLELFLDGVGLLPIKAILTVRQDEPVAGVYGVVGWSVDAVVRGLTRAGVEVTIEGRTASGRIFRGQAVTTTQSNDWDPDGVRATLALRGNGPLDGFDASTDFTSPI